MYLRKSQPLYSGKAKKIYEVEGYPHLLCLEFNDKLTAFNGEKQGGFEGKGNLNRQITSFVFSYLEQQSVPNHRVEDLGDREMICKKVKMIPLEVVVRNCVAGSMAKRLNQKEGSALSAPLVEFYYKSDPLGDPLISDEESLTFKAVKKQSQLDELKAKALQINELLKELFVKVQIDLIDFKLEFGFTAKGEILLADEISPDSCRLWDKTTGEKLDKDRFRQDLGKVKESYQEVWDRLKKLSPWIKLLKLEYAFYPDLRF